MMTLKNSTLKRPTRPLRRFRPARFVGGIANPIQRLRRLAEAPSLIRGKTAGRQPQQHQATTEFKFLRAYHMLVGSVHSADNASKHLWFSTRQKGRVNVGQKHNPMPQHTRFAGSRFAFFPINAFVIPVRNNLKGGLCQQSACSPHTLSNSCKRIIIGA